MDQKEEKSEAHVRFLENLDNYRDMTTWGNFTDNFGKLSFYDKLKRNGDELMEKLFQIETEMLKKLIQSLSKAEIEEWEEEMFQYFLKQSLSKAEIQEWEHERFQHFLKSLEITRSIPVFRSSSYIPRGP